MKQSAHLNPSEETATGCPVTSNYENTPPNKHVGVGRQQQQRMGGANSRFLGLVSVGAAQSLDQTTLRPSVIKRICQTCICERKMEMYTKIKKEDIVKIIWHP